MRAAIFEPAFHVCGPASMTEHIRAGFRDLGWSTDIVTFTKSGKRRVTWGEDGVRFGLAWWRTEPDRVAKIADAVDVLNEYDLIVLTEPKNMTLDREARKKGEEPPYYVTALEQVKTPWTAVLCGPLFQEERAPFLKQLLDSASCLGFVASGPDCAVTSPHLRPEDVPVVSYPFAARNSVDAPVDRRPVVGMTGRIIPNKGPGFLAWAADQLPDGYDVELHGASSIGTGPNFTFLIWEQMTQRGWEGERTVAPQYQRTGPDVLRPHPFTLKKNGKQLSYHGGYTDAVAVCERFGVHVSLTDTRYSTGVEFVLLEAVDAGAYPVLLDHLAVEPWACSVLGYTSPPSMTKLAKGQCQAELRELVDGITDACRIVDDPTLRQEAVRFNRELLRDRHDPATWCREVMDSLGFSPRLNIA